MALQLGQVVKARQGSTKALTQPGADLLLDLGAELEQAQLFDLLGQLKAGLPSD